MDIFLFTVDSSLREDLERNTISPRIRAAFNKYNLYLFDSAFVKRIKRNLWLIVDRKNRYAIEHKKGILRVYYRISLTKSINIVPKPLQELVRIYRGLTGLLLFIFILLIFYDMTLILDLCVGEYEAYMLIFDLQMVIIPLLACLMYMYSTKYFRNRFISGKILGRT